MLSWSPSSFFFTATATTEIYTLSLHDALPIWPAGRCWCWDRPSARPRWRRARSEEHTSELQSLRHLVCRLLLEKKNQHGSRIIRAGETRCDSNMGQTHTASGHHDMSRHAIRTD